jgi:UDP-GlcNAc:undecaprenyl-phosphate GlcNAc-1-phosphate transferase
LSVVQGWIELTEHQADLLAAIYLGLIGFFLIGFLDDLRSLPARPRLIAQFFVAALLVILSGDNGIRITAALGRFVFPEWLSIVVTILWIVAVVNTFNWIDGLDALAGGVGAICALAFLVIGILSPGLPNALLSAAICTILIGAILGYLPFNWHPAKIIMGDGGAFSVGYLLAVISILGLFKQAALISFLVPVAVLALPTGDTTYTILRRLFRGIPVTTPDKKHIHHRVLALLSQHYRDALPATDLSEVEEQLVEHRAHRNTVLALYAFTFLCAGVAVTLSMLGK